MKPLKGFAIAAALGWSGSAALAGAHTWDVNEVFSNADGTIQFIELREANGTPNEVNLMNRPIQSAFFGHQFLIDHNVVGPTSNRHFLLATQAFADLPGAPTPDMIIPADRVPFFNTGGDTVTYSPYDSMTFASVPTDGINSLTEGGIVAANSPTNYAGQTGSVDASGGGDPCPGDADGDNDVDITDLGMLLANFGATGPDVPGDVDGDGDVDITDLGILLANFGAPC